MQIVKYPVKEVEVKQIPNNRMLSLGITATQKALCKKSIRQYGLLTPIVIAKDSQGKIITLTGENELEIIKEMEVKKVDAFVIDLNEHADMCAATLMLSSLQNGLNALSEGLILRELISTGKYTQKNLAQILLKSRAWVCKRLALANQLNKDVSEMVLSNQLCATSAQYISQLPENVQHEFAIQVYSNDVSKSIVEQLVAIYNRNSTAEALRQEIISNPVAASNITRKLKIEKCRTKKQEEDRTIKFEDSIRLLLKLICELEVCFSNIAQIDFTKYRPVILAVISATKRFVNLAEHVVSPGKCKSLENTGGANNGND